jgi:type IV pilus assembly protein PilZ
MNPSLRMTVRFDGQPYTGAVMKKKSEAGAERREHKRKPVSMVINYETLDQFFEDYVTNISLGGVFIQSKNPLPIGTRLKIKFALPELANPIETTGVVAHVVNLDDEGDMHGMGIRFADLDPESKKLIDKLVNSHYVLD